MINTIHIKKQQLQNGYFQTGSGSEKMLIMGSCRVAPYVWYLDKWNTENGNRFTIYSIDPFNWGWNEKGERVDYEAALQQMETHSGLLEMLKSVDIFIHEFYTNAGMFNCNKLADKNIYQFGIKPKEDICIPNFNDLFILFGDIVKFDQELRSKAIQDMNVTGKLSEQTQSEIFAKSQDALNKFYAICLLSDIPEMKDFYQSNFIKKRMHHNFNHVTKHFTLAILMFMNYKYLKLNISSDFWTSISDYDMFESNFTKLTQYDLDYYGYEWEEPIEEIKPYL